MPDFRNPRIDLVSRKLPALTRLGPLRDLDLEIIGADQVFARDTEPRRRHLLDRASPRVAVSSAR